MFRYLKSILIMLRAHKGQKDKGGHPYYKHPLRVARGCKNNSAKIIALLHDVVEDNDNYKLDDFKFLNKDELEALSLLTHEKSVNYFTYINKVKTNELAREVKLSDLRDNSNLDRLKEVSKKDLERVKKYKKAQEILLS